MKNFLFNYKAIKQTFSTEWGFDYVVIEAKRVSTSSLRGVPYLKEKIRWYWFVFTLYFGMKQHLQKVTPRKKSEIMFTKHEEYICACWFCNKRIKESYYRFTEDGKKSGKTCLSCFKNPATLKDPYEDRTYPSNRKL